MQNRLVIYPKYGQVWVFSACTLDALLQAAAQWGCSSGELVDGYQAKRVRVMKRKEATQCINSGGP